MTQSLIHTTRSAQAGPPGNLAHQVETLTARVLNDLTSQARAVTEEHSDYDGEACTKFLRHGQAELVGAPSVVVVNNTIVVSGCARVVMDKDGEVTVLEVTATVE